MFAILAALVSISAACEAPLWQDLEKDRIARLTRTLEFPRSDQETVVIDEESPYALESARGLDGLNVILLSFKAQNCPTKWYFAHAEMILVDPTDGQNGSDRSVGIQLSTGCELDVYVETRDYASTSLFCYDGK